jgi:hypothetical protein
VAPLMVKQGGGSIINISTFAAFEPDPVFPTSGVFRAGLAAFTKLFADKYARTQRAHEQRAAGLHRQPAREGRIPLAHPDGPLRQEQRDRRRSSASWRRKAGATSPGRTCAVDGGITRSGAIILTGAGDRGFGAGQDLNETKTFDADRAELWMGEWERLYDRLPLALQAAHRRAQRRRGGLGLPGRCSATCASAMTASPWASRRSIPALPR